MKTQIEGGQSGVHAFNAQLGGGLRLVMSHEDGEWEVRFEHKTGNDEGEWYVIAYGETAAEALEKAKAVIAAASHFLSLLA